MHRWRKPSVPAPARMVAAALLGLLMTVAPFAGASVPVPDSSGDGAAGRRSAGGAAVASVSLQVLPPLSHPGEGPEPADAARTVLLARVSPARAGVPVLIEARSRSGWTDVGFRHTDERGVVETVASRARAFRAVAGGRTTPEVPADGWRLSFSDEFDREDLGAGWTHRGGTYNPEGHRACAKGDPRAVGLPGETLRLWVRRDPDRNDGCRALRNGRYEGPFAYRLNGHVSTEYGFTFTYGVAAARMRFQELPGQHASFWLQPKSPPAPGGYEPRFTGAEIDVIEYFGKRPGSSGLAQFTYHNDPVGNRLKTGGVLEGTGRFLDGSTDGWAERFHVFSVEWTPQEYVFRIDGQVTWRSREGISQRPEFLILSLLSSDYEIAAAGDRALGSQFAEVDWVRVWQQ